MKKKKIGIVTMIGSNMGNRLQNYAEQQIYRDLGYKPITLGRFRVNSGLKKYIGIKLYNFYHFLKGGFLNFFHHSTRSYYIAKFNRHIAFPVFMPSKDLWLGKVEKKFDFFSVGSDQVWNPRFEYLTAVDLLTFSPRQKNISFSASIGLDSLDGECDREFVRKAFLNFAHISVREYRAKEIIEEMTGRYDVEVFPDPTMLLSKEEWQKVERGGIKCKKKYIFMYFLDGIEEKTGEQIYAFARGNGYEVLEWSPRRSELKNRIGPSEWLYLIHHASYVCTDSFHACALSLVFNTPFTVFQRQYAISMYSRIETLIRTYSLTNIEYHDTVEIPQIDFEHVNEIMRSERERIKKLLKTWLQ